MELIELSTQYAVWPIWAILLAVGGGIGAIASTVSIFSEPLAEDLNLAILGTQGAGKTTLWRAITQSKESVEPTIGSETIFEKKVTLNGITRKIKQSIDISGGPDKVREEYSNLITHKDFIIFVFNIEEFMTSKEYKEEVKIRLKVIGKYIKKEKLFHIIGSHVDKLTDSVNKRKKIKSKIIQNLGYSLLTEINCDVNENLALMDLTNTEELDDYIYCILFSKQKQ